MILDSIENKQKILKNFLEISAFEGWSNATLAKACEISGIDPKFCNLIFENGCLDLIEFYIAEKNHKLIKEIAQNPNFNSLKIRDKIRFALYSIFESEQQNQMSLQRLQSFYFDLRNLRNPNIGIHPMIKAFKHAGKISDFIWKEIGDKSTDFNFYTKRLTLSKIILQTFPIFIKDDEISLEKTKRFIDEQIEKVMKFEKIKAKVKNFSNNIKEKSREFIMDESGQIKTPKQIIKDLPFVRLFKKKSNDFF